MPPAILLEEIPLSETASNVVSDTRQAVANALEGHDPRLVVIVGTVFDPDTGAALDYAEQLKALAEASDDVFGLRHVPIRADVTVAAIACGA